MVAQIVCNPGTWRLKQGCWDFEGCRGYIVRPCEETKEEAGEDREGGE